MLFSSSMMSQKSTIQQQVSPVKKKSIQKVKDISKINLRGKYNENSVNKRKQEQNVQSHCCSKCNKEQKLVLHSPPPTAISNFSIAMDCCSTFSGNCKNNSLLLLHMHSENYRGSKN